MSIVTSVSVYNTWFITPRAGVVAGLLLLLCMLTLPSLLDSRLSNDFRVYFSSDNPELSAYEGFEEDFTSHDSLVLMLVLQDESNSWLDPQFASLLSDVETSMWTIPTVHRVNALTNYQYTQVKGDELMVSPVLDLVNELGADRSAIEALFEADPQLSKVYLSQDQRVILFQADLYLDKNIPGQARQIYEHTDELRHNWQSQYSNINFYLLGSVTSNVTLEDAVADDLLLLVPITYIVIIIGLLYFLRSVRATVFTVIIITLSIIFTFSIYSLFKHQLTPVAGFVPTVVLTLAVADCVHYLMTYRYIMVTEGLSSHAANRQAFAINWLPITITSLTTSLGMLFLNLSDSPPYQDLGNMVAIGVMLAWLFTLLILPLLIHRYPIEYQIHDNTNVSSNLLQNNFMAKYANWLRHNQGYITAAMLVVVIISVIGLLNIRFSENWSKYFSEKFEVTQAVNIVKEQFNRLHRYEIVLRAHEENAVNSPAYLGVLDSLLNYLENQTKVEQIQSYGYILKRLNQVMNDDKVSSFKMPDSQGLAAQLSLMYEMSLPQGAGVENYITFDRRASRTTILLAPSESYELIEFERRLDHYFEQLSSIHQDEYVLEISGLDHIFSHIAERNIVQMLLGTSIALVMISILLMFIYGSAKYGFISLVPNLIPALIAYGLWGMFVGYIDLALSVVICMSLGIVVDDTVHFLSKYVHARKVKGYHTDEAIQYSFHIVGRALITTTIILVAGFSMMLFSPLLPTANTGALLSMTLIMALIVDFTLLPTLLRKTD